MDEAGSHHEVTADYKSMCNSWGEWEVMDVTPTHPTLLLSSSCTFTHYYRIIMNIFNHPHTPQLITASWASRAYQWPFPRSVIVMGYSCAIHTHTHTRPIGRY